MKVNKVIHLNCGSMCPVGGSVFSKLIPQHFVCHCLLLETSDGLVLVDTGIGTRDIQNPSRLGMTSLFFKFHLKSEETALHQIKALGYGPNDVRHIICTHLDLDHAGGISDFPEAKIHVLKEELAAIQNRRGVFAKMRYRPGHIVSFDRYIPHIPEVGERWHGFERVQALAGFGDQILLVPLRGHTAGHLGVAITTNGRTMFHAGDCYYEKSEMQDPAAVKPWIRAFEYMGAENYGMAHDSRDRLRVFANSGSGVEVFCSHDRDEFRGLLGV